MIRSISILILNSLIGILVPFTCLGQNWELVWSDEFEGTSLNSNYWKYETGNGQGGWGTGQLDFATSRKENVDVKNGKLIITLRHEDYHGFEYTSGRIHSRDLYSVKYGKIEARIKVAAGRGVGCAFWMLPQYEKYGWWPASGEIDIVETNGHEPYRNYGTVHFKQWETHQYKGHDVISETSLATEMHLYTLLWDENSIKWYLDGKLYNEVFIKEPIDGRKPFNEAFYFIVSGGVGSDFSGKNIEDKLLPQTFEVDYIRVYKQAENPHVLSASANGNEVEVLFSEHLRNPDLYFKDFEITDRGKKLAVASADMKPRDNRIMILKTATPIAKNSVLTLRYVGDSISSLHNVKLEKSKSVFILNNSVGSPPVPINVVTNSDFTIEVTLNKNCTVTKINPEDFIVKVNGEKSTLSGATISYNTSNKIMLQTVNPLFKKDTISVGYSGTNILSADSGVLIPFSDFEIKNTLTEKYLVPGKIEAENYSDQQGIQTETCKDIEGGRNVGYIDDGDWIDYKIYVNKPGKYRIDYRTSSKSATGELVLKIGDNTLTKTTIRPTNDWQVWSTVSSDNFLLEKGIYTLRLYALKGDFNLNWFSVVEAGN